MKVIGWIVAVISLLMVAIGIMAPIIVFGVTGIYSIFGDYGSLCLLSCLAGIVILVIIYYIRKVFAEPQY